ncbi:MAG: right-handed parallel beta-helix repeat-containing protein [Thermoplasmata archaeon]|nr:MAG: right-handed parallel beta-helix repeat-containing protein [Thermoplasmata archaeon]
MNSDRKKLVIRIFSILLIILLSIKGLFLIPSMIDNATSEGSTEISGFISSDAVWALENSPYIIIENTLVEENVNLTIEPGVIIKFNSDKYIRIDGTLYAVGTESNIITFTSNSKSPERGDWGKIQIEKTSKDSIIKYCRVEYSSEGIDCSALMISITDSTFYTNGNGIDLHDCDSIIMNNEFINNELGVNEGKNIINNVFIKNGRSILYGENVTNNIVINNDRGIINSNLIQNNYILNNNGGVDIGRKIKVYNNYIVNNSEYGINILGSANENITNNIITNNEIGIEMEQGATSQIMNNKIANNKIGINIYFSSSSNEDTNFTIRNNNIQDNIEYNFRNSVEKKYYMNYNWWGTTDTSLIDISIYDYQDDFELGKVEYLPILESPVDVILQNMLPISELDLSQYDLDEPKEDSDDDFIDFLGSEFFIAISVIVIVLGLSIFFYRRKRRDV